MALIASFNNLRKCNAAPGSVSQTINCYFVNAAFTTFTSRSVNSGNLFSNSAVVGDMWIFRIAYGINKYAGMQFSISTAMASTSHTIVWEYYKADGSWGAFTSVVDNTNHFKTTGVNSVTWDMPTDWGTNATSVNGITGAMWVRARLSAATGITNGGAINDYIYVYDYAITIADNSVYDTGTATSGAYRTIYDTSKAWSNNELKNRVVWFNNGTNSGKMNVIINNDATSFSMNERDDVTPYDNTSQYVILNNFNDIYNADVAAGWGKISKMGLNSYYVDCFIIFQTCAFGDLNASIEFDHDFIFFCEKANTNDYPMIFGFRLPPVYGLDKTIHGNRFLFNSYSVVDNRAIGFTNDSDYSFSYGNNYIYKYETPINSSYSYLRMWFVCRFAQSINDYFEGWRSVTWTRSSGIAEVRNLNVCYGHSGLEQLKANYYGVNSYYNTSLGMFITNANTYNLNGLNIGLNNPLSSRFSPPLQYYTYTGTANINDYKGVRIRPFGDVYGSTPNTFNTLINYSIKGLVMDEKGNFIPNVKFQITDSLNNNKKTYLFFDGGFGNNDTLTAPNHATGNQFYGSTAFSFEAWIFPRSQGGSSLGRIFEKGTSGGVGYGMYITGGQIKAFVQTSTGTKTSNGTTIKYLAWHHIVGVWDGTYIRIYQDTIGVANVTATGTATNDTTNSLYIGSSVTASRTFDGYIKRVRLFRNKALTTDEIATLWNLGNYIQNESCPVTGCTAEYNFTEGTGTTVTDTINSNTATLGSSTAAPTWIDTNTGLTTQNITTTTGSTIYYSGVANDGSYSLDSQPATARKLRITISNFSDLDSTAGYNARIFIQGTNSDGAIISELIFFEEMGNGIYYTQNEYLTVNSNGLTTGGLRVPTTMQIDDIGIIPNTQFTVENWSAFNDINGVFADYNPLTIKISKAGFEPITIKKYINESIDDNITLKKKDLIIDI